MAFICGSFNNQEEDDFEVLWPFSPIPSRTTSKHRFCCRRNKLDNKNPYANRGLDKFEALLADLDGKKQKIFTQKGSEYISFVRFVYSNSNDIKPIIVRLKHPQKHDKDHHKKLNHKDTKSSTLDHHQNLERKMAVAVANKGTNEAQEAQPTKPSNDQCRKMIKADQWKLNIKRKLEEWWMPLYYLPLFVMFILVFLTFFGRSLAIIFTSLAWYLIPTIDGTLENTKTKPKKMIKKEYSRKPSDIKMIASPRSFHSGPIVNGHQEHKMKKLMSF